MATPTPAYRGRFAPSPTGPLHFGSLVAAVGSYLQAKVANGQWHVRIDDLDTPRVVRGSADEILRALETYRFEWDGPVLYQSKRQDLYEAALFKLRERGLTYECSCSRTEIEAHETAGTNADGELRYPGTCRQGPRHPDRTTAIRFRVPDAAVVFDDRLQGRVNVHLPAAIGDFVVKRRDGLFAYQLAVVVDDQDQAITEVVRGADLLYATPRQIALQQALDFNTPAYRHLPVATDASGRKLSKSTLADALELCRPEQTLHEALVFLGQHPPAELGNGSLAELWHWAASHWNPAALTKIARKPSTQRSAIGHCATNALL